jgi:hypothetical protein
MGVTNSDELSTIEGSVEQHRCEYSQSYMINDDGDYDDNGR